MGLYHIVSGDQIIRATGEVLVDWKEDARALLLSLYDDLYDLEDLVQELESAIDNGNIEAYLGVKREVEET